MAHDQRAAQLTASCWIGNMEVLLENSSRTALKEVKIPRLIKKPERG
jgi:hypothetical protein